MARYVDSRYETTYGRAATPPTYDSYDRSYGSYSARGGGVVGDAWRVPQRPVGYDNSYKRDETVDNVQKPYPSQATAHGYSTSGQPYQPSEYGDYSSNMDWRRSGSDNYRGVMTAMVPTEGYVAPRPGHGTGSLSKPTNDIGAAIELLKDNTEYSSASGSYPHQQQVGSRYTESASTVYYYPEIMPHTMDPTKRYGNINLGSRRPAVAEFGRNYY
ncbi:hypothetical protein NL676_030676 [Syzygium grande]|nr:hypothetical protein NL676_030676 [Syzygium grande]